MNRIVIYPKDIMIITGRSLDYSYRLLRKMKKAYCKSAKQPVTFDEFCDYMLIPPQAVEKLFQRRVLR